MYCKYMWRTNERMAQDRQLFKEIRSILLEWGKRHIRSFPWRETRDPWKVLLAEVLLHRTRADQVVPVYRKVVEHYPDPFSLATARLDDLERMLRPLGLHWRVSLLLEMARTIVREYDGHVPVDRESLRALPGISDYIAGAVRCFAFGLPDPVLDTNTVRVLGRLFGLRVTDSSRRSRRFRELMEAVVEGEDPRDLVLSILDLAALVCRPRDPRCMECPLYSLCQHGRSRQPDGIAQ